jgi:CHAT domain-containing protein
MSGRLWRIGSAVLTLHASCAAQAFTITPGKTIARVISSGDVHRYEIDMPADGVVRMFIRQVLPFETTVRLSDSNSHTVLERSSRQNMIVSAVLAGGGHYSLEVTAPTTPPGSGRYTIGNIEVRRANSGDETLLEADANYTQYRRRAAGSSEEAATKLDAAAELYKERNESDFQGWSLLVGGQYRVKLSEYRQAAERYARSATAFREAGNDEGRARALDFLADISVVLRSYPEAIDAASEALPLARANHLADIEATSLSNLGRSYSALGEKQRALDFFQQAIVLARGSNNGQQEAAVLAAAAALHNSLGDHSKALELYQDALAIHRARKAPLDEAAALSNIGSSYASLHEPAKAIDSFQQAITLFRSTGGGRPALATTLSDLGQAYLAMKEPRKALPLFEDALAIARETKNLWSEAYALMSLGRMRREANDFGAAMGLLADALAIFHNVGDAQVEAVTRFEIAKLERARGNLEASREQVAAAISLMETLRTQTAVPDLRSALVASVGEYYELHVDLLMQLGRPEEAREAAERLRARNLQDVLTAAGVGSAVPRDPELAAREVKLHHDLDELSSKRVSLIRSKNHGAAVERLDRQIDDAWTEYQSVRVKLIAANPQSVSLADASTIDLNAVRRETLDADTLLLEYSLGEPRSYLWAVSRDQIRGYKLPGRAQIEDAARAFWSAVKGGADTPSVERAATRLSQMVLAPAARLLAKKRLLIVADGALLYAPFAALADPAQPGRYSPLTLTHEIIGEPSATSLALLRRGNMERRPAARALAVFADPVFEENDQRLHHDRAPAVSVQKAPPFLTRAAELHLERLPSTRREGQSIAALLPEPDRWLALDFDASRAAATSARLIDYRILHFATHGVVESAHPELTALALSLYDAQGRPQDGFLRLYEIYNLKLQADLVVLSACETALGKDVRGEGLVGLARGFMHAGATRVVASLWKVDDQATSELMRIFYKEMLGPEHKPAAAALRFAQLTISRQERWRSPYYWGAFVLQGEWR